MYVGAENSVKTMHKKIVGYPFLVGLHTFNYFFLFLFFALIRNKPTMAIQDEVPICLLFIDNVILFSFTRNETKDKLEFWRKDFESHGLRI